MIESNSAGAELLHAGDFLHNYISRSSVMHAQNGRAAVSHN